MALHGTSIIKCTCFGRPSLLEARLYRKYQSEKRNGVELISVFRSSTLLRKKKQETESGLLLCFGRRLFSETNTGNRVQLINVFLSSTLPETNTGNGAFHFIFHRFSPFNCCLSVIMLLDKGDYPENLQVLCCPNK